MATFSPSSFNPHDPAFLADPYPTYAQFRATAPVYRVTTYGDAWWVFSHEHVTEVCLDTNTYLKNPPPSAPPYPNAFDVLSDMKHGLFFMDPPRHTAVRPCFDGLQHAGMGGIVAETEGRASRRLGAVAGSAFEFWSGFALPVAREVFFSAFSVPAEHWPLLGLWVETVLAGHDKTRPLEAQIAAGTSAMALLTYFQAFLLGCPKHRTPQGLLERMANEMATNPTGLGMTPDEVEQCALNFALGGYLSAAFLLATGTLNLLRHPSEWAKLRANPALAEAAVEEMLRYDAPFQIADRYVSAAGATLAGQILAPRAKVLVVYGSANRDPAIFGSSPRDPDVFDIDAGSGNHYGLGHGIHHCIGAEQVRLLAPTALRKLVMTLPRLRLAGLVQWQTNPYFRSPESFPVATH